MRGNPLPVAELGRAGSRTISMGEQPAVPDRAVFFALPDVAESGSWT